MLKRRMSEKSKNDSLSAAISETQLEKLKLEIEQMKNKSSWYEWITPYTGLLSVIITVGGFIFGIVQFQKQQEKTRSEQEKQRTDEIQKRFEINLEKLLQYTKEEKTAVATVGNLLVNLKTYIREAIEIF